MLVEKNSAKLEKRLEKVVHPDIPSHPNYRASALLCFPIAASPSLFTPKLSPQSVLFLIRVAVHYGVYISVDGFPTEVYLHVPFIVGHTPRERSVASSSKQVVVENCCNRIKVGFGGDGELISTSFPAECSLNAYCKQAHFFNNKLDNRCFSRHF